MNVKNKIDPRNGSALLLALFLLVALSMILGSYLYLVSTERQISQRSLAWNTAIPAAEAGVEEALTAIYYGTNTLMLTSNSWAYGGDGKYHKTRTLPNGSKYSTAIQVSTTPAVIWSTGYVAAPFSTNTYLRRLVQVMAIQSPNVGGGIIATGSIAMSGGSILNSYDSSLGPYGTNNMGSNAVASSNSKTAGAINMSGGSSHIYGVAATGPGGTVTATGGASVVGSTRNDANVQIDPVPVPVFSNYSATIPSGTITFGGTNYTHGITNGGIYQVSTLVLGGSQKMVVNGDAVIYVTFTGNNAVNVGGSAFIYLTPGSSLRLYSAGQVVLSGGGVMNGNADTSKMTIFGLPTCTQITYSGSANFYGVVNAPAAAFTLSSSTAAAFGSFTVGSANITGAGGVHYDVNLGGAKGFIVQSWNELSP